MDTELQIRKIMKNLFLKNKKIRWLLLFFGIVVAICVVLIIRENAIPSWVKWQKKQISIRKGEDEKAELILDKKAFAIYDSKGDEIFRSDKAYKIQDVIAADIDNDGQEEILAILWKKGIYGKHMPFWKKTDEKNYSQHLFIYRFEKSGNIVPMWGASETGILINRIKTYHKNSAMIMCESVDKEISLWRWNDWGLRREESDVSFVAFGDNLIHTEIYEYAEHEENGKFDFLYVPFTDEIRNADIAALNAETVLVEDRNQVSGYPIFGSPKEVGEAIADAGFDIAACANNHIMDKGISALDYTYNFYQSKDILCPGIQKSSDTSYKPYELISRNGIRFAVFSYTYGTNVGDISKVYPYAVHYFPQNETQEKELLRDFEKARKEADFIIVFAHWGEEYQKEVTKQQKEMAALFAKAGADLVIGSHPHVVQETETIKRDDGGDTLIYYSLGNFRANQGMNEETRTGGEAKVVISHTWDGVTIKSHELELISAFWK